MIADHRDVGNLQRRHRLGEIGVGFKLAPMGEIAGHDRKRRVGLMGVDVRNRRIQPRARIEAVKLQAGVRQVRVGEVDEFEGHGALL